MSVGGRNGGPQGLFKIYRVTIRERLREECAPTVVEIPARTQGAARREALRQYPDFVVLAVQRVD